MKAELPQIPPYEASEEGYSRVIDGERSYLVDVIGGQLIQLTPAMVADRLSRHRTYSPKVPRWIDFFRPMIWPREKPNGKG